MMTEISDANIRQLLLCGLISVGVFVIYSVLLFSRTFSFLDIGFQVPASAVAGVAMVVGSLHGLISGAMVIAFQVNSILLRCVLSVVATIVLFSIPLVIIWLLNSARPRGEFGEYYYSWLSFVFIIFFVPSLVSGLLAGILI